MNFEDLQPVSTTADRITEYWPGKADQRKEGMTVTGKLLGKFVFSEGQEDESTVYKIRNGETVYGVQGYAPIARVLETVPVGSVVGIRFNGKKKSPKTNYMYNDFEVRVSPATEKEENTAKAVLGVEELKLEDFEDVPFN